MKVIKCCIKGATYLYCHRNRNVVGLVLFKNPKQKILKQNFLHRNERSESIAFWCNDRCFFIKVEGSFHGIARLQRLEGGTRFVPVFPDLPHSLLYISERGLFCCFTRKIIFAPDYNVVKIFYNVVELE